ncbi:PREDICTED: cyclin-dependent kinase inhibitor 5-like isoform X2 [Ipomoea nil]|uniref:cyclin-dependent kinase inhibitor 5-like isoform X2 n=1 Tax=Ipomoea nil TaxID=35883 RepID=UPI0009009943|nr:PREDICTED: cyclin-dependent kinase inhibitor 5-like isoform X2 [Ipomoea nil]
MGRYMKKSKAAGEVALLEVTHAQSFSGVRTRAKTLALQRLRRSADEICCAGDSGSYLQLRSRRLQKPPIGLDSRRQKPSPKDSNPSLAPNSKQNQSTRASSRVRHGCSAISGSVNKEENECLVGVIKEENILPEKCGAFEENSNKVHNTAGDAGDEASFGENLPDFEGRERTTRESTPCSLIRDSDAAQTPGSSTRPTSASEANSRMHNSLRRHIPTTHEINEFFAGAEEEQHRKFIDKYNFDPMNEKPLPGRFEWEKVNP